jgi:DNA-binding transcriptional LysR family regulator
MDTLLTMRAFALIAQAGSFAAAARMLGVSPAVMTKRVQSLEQRIGARLLDRSVRHIRLTEAGSLYREHCCRVLEELDYAEAEAGTLGRLPRGRLRVSAPYDFSDAELETAVLDFRKDYPEIALDLLLTNDFIDLVGDGCDMAVRIAGRNFDGPLVARRLALSRLLVCAAPEYLRRERPRVPADLKRHDCLIYTGAAWREEWPFKRNGHTKSIALSGSLRSNDNLLLCRAAVAGLGITIQPSFNVWRQLRAGELETVLDDWSIENLGVHAVFSHRRLMPAKVRAFVDFLARRFARSTDRDIWLERARG